MEIETLDTVCCSHVYPEDERLEWSAGRIESWDAALVRVRCDDGTVGWGEAGHALTGTEAVPGIVDALRDDVEGRDPRDVQSIRADCVGRNRFWARGGLPAGVIGAIEIACYDAWGRATDRPVYDLLGGRTDPGRRVPTYGSGGIDATIDGRVDQVAAYADRGFDRVKLRGTGDPARDRTLLERVGEALPPDVTVLFDAVQGSAGDPWTASEAIRLGRTLDEYGERIGWYEEPCGAADLDGFRRVRDAVDVPVTGIESRTGRHEWREVIEAGACDILQPDVAIAGGLTETARIVGHAASHDLPVALHVWGTGVSLLANAHFALATPGVSEVEYCQLPNPLRESMLPDGFTCDGTHITVPAEPGLGLSMPANLTGEFAFVPGKGHVFD